MLADLLNTPAWVLVGKRRWPLLITHGVLLETGRELGVDAIAGGLDVPNPSARLMRALLWAALARSGAALDREGVGDFIRPWNIAEIRGLLLRAWVSSMPDVPAGARPDDKPFTSRRAWAIARIELGVSDAEWLAMTPRQAGELSAARLERMQREEILVGTIAAATANFGFCRPESPMKSTDFMIHPFEAVSVDDDGPLTAEKILRGRKLYEKR